MCEAWTFLRQSGIKVGGKEAPWWKEVATATPVVWIYIFVVPAWWCLEVQEPSTNAPVLVSFSLLCVNRVLNKFLLFETAVKKVY